MDKFYSSWEKISKSIFKIPESSLQNGELSQQNFHDQENTDQLHYNLELTRPYAQGRSYEYLHLYNLRRALQMLKKNKFPLKDQELLGICCGRGMDMDFFARQGAFVSGMDIALTSLKIAENRLTAKNSPAFGQVKSLYWGSAQKLPFPNHSFDLVYAHDGLHHLENPLATFREMFRLARHAVLIIEPNNSLLLKILSKFKLVPSYEASGNQIFRFSPKVIKQIAKDNQFNKVNLLYTSLMYPHAPCLTYKILDWPIIHSLMKASLSLLQILIGKQSNHLIFLAIK